MPSGFGTPTAVVVTACASAADGSATNGAAISWGASDGTNQWVNACCAEHGVADTDTLGYGNQIDVVMILDPVAQAVVGRATCAPFSDEKVSLYWSLAPPAAYKIVVWACTGTTKAIAGTDTNTQAVDGTQVTSLSGMAVPDAIIMGSGVTAPIIGAISTSIPAQLQMGFVSYDGTTIRQVGQGLFMEDGNASGQNAQFLSTDTAIRPPDDGSSGAAPGLSVSAIASGSFTTTKLIAAENLAFSYLALDTPGEVYAGTWTLATGTPTYDAAFDLPGGVDDFVPHGVFVGMTGLNSDEANGEVTNVRAGTFGIAMFDLDVDSGHTVTIQNRRGSATTDTQSFYSSKVLDVQNHAGTSTLLEGTVKSTDDDGFTAAMTDSPANAKIYPVLVMGNLTAGPTALSASPTFPAPTIIVVVDPDDRQVPIDFPWPTVTVALTVSPAAMDAGDVVPGPTISQYVPVIGVGGRTQTSRGGGVTGTVASQTRRAEAVRQNISRGGAEAASVARGYTAVHEVGRGGSVASD